MIGPTHVYKCAKASRAELTSMQSSVDACVVAIRAPLTAQIRAACALATASPTLAMCVMGAQMPLTLQCFHGSDSPESVRREFALVFEGADLDWLVDQANSRL